MNSRQFLALVYADLFDTPLFGKELTYWQIAGFSRFTVPLGAHQNSQGFYFLTGRDSLVSLRRQREKISRVKEKRARDWAAQLGKVRFVEAVFLTGSITVGNAKEGADIDLMVITRKNTLWLTRALVVGWLKLQRAYRKTTDYQDKICPNIFLTTDSLEIKNKNLFTAHEVLQAKCLFDRGGVAKKWLEENKWTQKHLPVAYKDQIKVMSSEITERAIIPLPTTIISFLWWLLELFAFTLQHLYMKPKMTRERIGRDFAFFHPRDLAEIVLPAFEKRIKQYGLPVFPRGQRS